MKIQNGYIFFTCNYLHKFLNICKKGIFIFFPASLAGFFPIVGVSISSSHLHHFIFTPSLTPSHLHTFSSSQLLSHLLIFTSAHLHLFSYSHLVIFTPSHLHIGSPSHLLLFTSFHPHTFSPSHLRSHPLIFWSSLSLSLSRLLYLLSLGRVWCQRGVTKHEPLQTRWGSIVKNWGNCALLLLEQAFRAKTMVNRQKPR